MIRILDTLFVIPARGGSKGIPGKNIKLLGGKPLINYTLDAVREVTSDNMICVSTDSDEIIKVVQDYGLKVPFKRPPELAKDTSGSYEVIIHAMNHFESKGYLFEKVVLLQPTSPFRTGKQIEEAFNLLSADIDMIISVGESESNPYYDIVEEDSEGFLKLSKESNYIRRQDCPEIYRYNGAIYVINVASLKKTPLHQMKKVKKYLMDGFSSVDIDNPMDWMWAEFLIQNPLSLI